MSLDVIGGRANEWQVTGWLYKRFSQMQRWLASLIARGKKTSFSSRNRAVSFWFRHRGLVWRRVWWAHRNANWRSSEKSRRNIFLREPSFVSAQKKALRDLQATYDHPIKSSYQALSTKILRNKDPISILRQVRRRRFSSELRSMHSQCCT